MRKNIFLKSMLRQPVRTGLLILLIGLASFAFFLRTVEYVTVRAEIRSLGGIYRSIGLIRAADYWADVSEAAAIIENSPFVRHTERRVGVEGILQDMYSPDFAGRVQWLPDEAQTRVNDALFTATLLSTTPVQPWTSHWQLVVEVQEVFAGFPAHATERQRMTLWGFSPDGADGPYEEMNIGSTYLLRGEFIMMLSPFGTVQIPRPGIDSSWMAIRPLNDDGLWFMSASRLPEGNDFSQMPELAHLPEHITFLNHHQRAVYLQPTRDMSALPTMQREAPIRMGWHGGHDSYLFRIRHGRLLDHDDYLQANPVAVVTSNFAFYNSVKLGDVLTVSIPTEQHVIGLAHGYRDLIIRSTPEEYPTHVVELEIVGILSDFIRSNTVGSFDAAFIYIPASLLPDGLTLSPPAPETVPGWYDYDHLPSIWFSFELADTRQEQAFFDAYSGIIHEMGFSLALFEGRSQVFWAAASPMLTVITFNAIVFWAVLVLVLALVVFLFLQQRSKDMAVGRALGFSVGRLLWRFIGSALCFGVPAVLVGGALGWHHALGVADYTLSPLSEVIADYEPALDLSIRWFVWMGAGVIALLLAFIAGGVGYISRFPVLDQLQGINSGLRQKKRKAAATVEENTDALPKIEPIHTGEFILPQDKLVETSSERLSSRFRFILRHIARSPAKSVLGVLIALFFVMVLGWLTESILRSYESIDQLYATTVVRGEIFQANPWQTQPDRYLGDIIRRRTVDSVRDSGFVENFYIEAGHFRSFVIPPAPDGTFPENWYDVIEYDRSVNIFWNLNALDFLFAFNDIGLFMDENYMEGIGGLSIDYAAGFGPSDFMYAESEPIPIIISESIAERRGVGLGDPVFVGYTPNSPATWRHVPAKIIGIHDDNIARENARGAVLMPVDAAENILGGVLMYSTLRFTVKTEYNREISDVFEYLNDIALHRTAGLLPLWLNLRDQILYTLVGVASQTLLLLELVYPVALGASVLIAGGLSMLLMLQTAKNAAILHVLGATKKNTMAMLLCEQVLVCLAGVAPGLLALAVMGVSFGGVFLLSVGLYFGAVLLGAVIGAVLVINRQPLELLQVRE